MSDQLVTYTIVGLNVILLGFLMFSKWVRVSVGPALDKIRPMDSDEDVDPIPEPKRKRPVIKGTKFGVVLDFMVIGVFFDLDRKYAVVCPELENKLIDFGWVVGVNDDQEIEVESSAIDKTVYTKGLGLFKLYKESNPNRFH